MNHEEIILKAEKIRWQWGLDTHSPIDVLSQGIEKMNNLSVLAFPMNDGLKGCSTRFGDEKIICLNSNYSKGSLNFIMAHEIYHLCFDKQNESFACSTDSNQENEIKADIFASNLLIPPMALFEFIKRNSISRWDLSDVIGCEQYFNISHTAMLKRLETEGLITKSQALKYGGNVLKKALKLGYAPDLYVKSRQYYAIGRIVRLISESYERDKISTSKYNSMMLNIFRGDLAYDLIEEECGTEVRMKYL